MRNDDYDLKNIYFDGNQLSDTRPKSPVKDVEVAQEPTKDQKKMVVTDKKQRPQSEPVKPTKSHAGKKKHKHSKRKGMHHKRTEK